MREYKFRGKRISDGEWVYGFVYQFLSEDGPKTYIYASQRSDDEVNPKTVGQFIGIIDSHKKEIYEGQTLRDTIHDMWYKVVFDGGRYTGRVIMHGPICGGSNIDDISKLHMLFYEIIDPELMGVKV